MRATPRDRDGNPIGFGTVRFGFTMYQWYWERQLGPFVVMWQHDGAHKGTSKLGPRIGRLYVWYDHFASLRGYPKVAWFVVFAVMLTLVWLA